MLAAAHLPFANLGAAIRANGSGLVNLEEGKIVARIMSYRGRGNINLGNTFSGKVLPDDWPQQRAMTTRLL